MCTGQVHEDHKSMRPKLSLLGNFVAEEQSENLSCQKGGLTMEFLIQNHLWEFPFHIRLKWNQKMISQTSKPIEPTQNVGNSWANNLVITYNAIQITG